jgi:hypothetical protein
VFFSEEPPSNLVIKRVVFGDGSEPDLAVAAAPLHFM